MFNIHLLPASFGDSILVEYGCSESPKYILIDGGPYYAFDEIDAVLRSDYPHIKEVELLVVTHIDIDHIDGIIVMLNQDTLPYKINEIWFNGYDQLNAVIKDELGGKQGEFLGALIEHKNLTHNHTYFNGKPIIITKDKLPIVQLKGGMELTLLSPTAEGLKELKNDWEDTLEKVKWKPGDKAGSLIKLKEDYRYEYEPKDVLGDFDFDDLVNTISIVDKSAANRSSIAFLAEYNGKSCLFAGDAPTDLLLESLSRISKYDTIAIDAWKLAHHGSNKSTHSEIIEKIDCKKMLISTDGKKYKHPNQELIAKLIHFGGPYVHLFFNYKSQFNIDWDDDYLKDKHEYECCFPENNERGIKIEL